MIDRIAELRSNLSPRKRTLLKIAGFALLPITTASVLLGCAPQSEASDRFKAENYKYLILVEKAENLHVGIRYPYTLRLYTNEPPQVLSEGGQNRLEARNVYCPRNLQSVDTDSRFTSIRSLDTETYRELGCPAFVEQYVLLSPRAITYFPQW